MAFPATRLRRLRRTGALRSMVRETRLTAENFVYPLFICPGEGVRKEVLSMPGVFNLSVDETVKEAREAHSLGIPALILFGLSRILWLSLALMVFVGFGLMQAAAISNTIIQSLVPEDKRARAMSYYTMAFFGAAPFGSLLAGALAHRIGAPNTVILTGACCVAGSLWFTFELPKIRTVIRPIYEDLGLLPVRDVELTPEELESAL